MILVTGANGFVGHHLVPRLLERDRVRALVRRGADITRLPAQKIDIAYGNVTHLDSLRAAMDGIDTVVHLVAVPLEKYRSAFQAINANGTRNTVQAATSAGVKRFIHLSALGAGNDPRYAYTYSKWLGEEAVRASGIAYTIFRPSALFGEGDGFFSAIAGLMKLSPVIFPSPGDGKTIFQPIWIQDLATCVVKSLDDARTINQTIELGGLEHLTYDAIVRAIAGALGTRRAIVHVPLPLMRVPVFFFDFLPYPPVSSSQLRLLNVPNYTAIDSVEKRFGFKPRRLSEGLEYMKNFDLGAWLRARFQAP